MPKLAKKTIKVATSIRYEVKSASERERERSGNLLSEELIVAQAKDRIKLRETQNRSIWVRMRRSFSQQLNLHQDCESPTEILPFLVLGGRENASNFQELYHLGVTHVLNTAKQLPNYHEGKFIYMKINLIDSVDEKIDRYFNQASKFIKHVAQIGGKVFVHCISGVSRSVTIILAYLIKYKKYRLSDAYNMIKRKRPIIKPNEAFRLQIAKYEVKRLGISSVANTGNKDWSFYSWNIIKSEYT